MNAVVTIPKYEEAIQDARSRFLAQAVSGLNYDTEEIFAIQAIMKSEYAMNTANRNPDSVHLAMINVASTGLTLNPAMGYAYLVPRDNAIVLDISYKGLIKIATDTGAIKWARAECVFENDTFTYRGPAAMPEIVADPFRPRGEIIGAYCIAKTPDGDILTEVMDMAAIEMIRSKSAAWTQAKPGKSKGPWEDFFPEMARKAVIKRARKTWPYSDTDGRLAKAVEIANQAEGGYVFEDTPEEIAARKLAARKAVHDEAYGRHSESIAYIKELLSREVPDIKAASEEWALIPQADQMALWLATTKGGCFTTLERATIKEKFPAQIGDASAAFFPKDQ